MVPAALRSLTRSSLVVLGRGILTVLLYLCSSSEFWSSDIDQCVSCSSCKQYPKTPSCNTCKKTASSSCSAEPIEETTGPLYQA
uniref:TNFR-Cys domain-containing protein n=1 Tax=Salmo trutta TaxID=8032 RepID=A0A673YBZ8_SALTR